MDDSSDPTDASSGGGGGGTDDEMLLADGSRLTRDRLAELIAAARVEAWEIVSPTRPAPVLPAGVTRYEAAVDSMLEEAHLTPAHGLPALIDRYAVDVGALGATAYLADLQQIALVPFVGPDQADDAERAAPLAVDTTLAGRAYQHLRILTGAARSGAAGPVVWLPLLDGTERLGVLRVTVPAGTTPDEISTGALGLRLRRLAGLAAELVVTKTLYGDTIVQTCRRAPMGLAAELQWSALPPLTFACHQVTIAAALEPAYAVAGDAVDYAVDEGWARFAIFDGMGHGLQSAHLSVLAVAAYRNARRAGRSLPDTARALDEAVRAFSHDEMYCSALVGELDTETGELSWINAGHPEPLVLRAGRLARTLHVEPSQPFGMGPALADAGAYVVGTAKLQPDDRLVLYTDGVTDAQGHDGTPFGLPRLVDLLARSDDPHLPAPETMRRVVRALLRHQQELTDDATLLSIDWRSDDGEDLLPQ